MTFRYARHTKDLERIEEFYTKIVALEKPGSFQNHAGYSGVFLGHTGSNWHLEFTTSEEKPQRKFDEDDLLVFYLNSEIEFSEVKRIIAENNISPERPKNPYWSENGFMIQDPDGCKVVFARKNSVLQSQDKLTRLVTERSIHYWSDLIEYIRQLPYGRNQNREDFSLVLKEGKGTCSSKHAFLKKIADLNGIENVKLIMGVYKMNPLNSPKTGRTIPESGLDYIPEAHCYLKLGNRRFDVMSPDSHFRHFENDLLEEVEIEPEQVNVFKVEFHKSFLKRWIAATPVHLDFEQVWAVREQCIKKLGE